ncbi:MAG TPA: hypothetical protein VIR33_02995 [Thermopolyspora sp.]|jgi:hypothetical protein
MAPTAATLLLIASALTGGVVQANGALAAQPAAMPAAVAARSTTSASTPTNAARTKPHRCYDGKCRITVRKPVRFRVSPRLGMTSLSISRIGPKTVTVQARGHGTFLKVVLSSGGRGTLNTVGVRALRVSKGTAKLLFYPTR